MELTRQVLPEDDKPADSSATREESVGGRLQSSGVSVDNPPRFTASSEDMADIPHLSAKERHPTSDRCDPRLVRRCSIFASASALFGIVAGLSVLAGWTFDIPRLLTWGSATPMAPNAAAGSVLAGISLWLLRKHDNQRVSRSRNFAAKVLSAMVALLGVLSLAEHLFVLDPRIDRLLLLTAPAADLSIAKAKG